MPRKFFPWLFVLITTSVFAGTPPPWSGNVYAGQKLSLLVPAAGPGHYRLNCTAGGLDRSFTGTISLNGYTLKNGQSIQFEEKSIMALTPEDNYYLLIKVSGSADLHNNDGKFGYYLCKIIPQ